jgi:hypothetical protein
MSLFKELEWDDCDIEVNDCYGTTYFHSNIESYTITRDEGKYNLRATGEYSPNELEDLGTFSTLKEAKDKAQQNHNGLVSRYLNIEKQ